MSICMIPARQGSIRLARKNYLKIGDFTVLEITINKAIKSKVFDSIVVNTDDPKLEEVTKRLGVEFYLRDKDLASSEATSDQVVLDFFNNNQGDRVFWVNTVSPLQTIDDIKQFVVSAKKNTWKSGVSINSTQVHSLFNELPLNFEWEEGFARTQDLKPIKVLNYAMMGWHRDMVKYLKKGQLFNHDTELIESSRWSSFLLKNENDMHLIRDLSKIAPNQGLKF